MLHFIFNQYYRHGVMRQSRDVRRTDGIVTCGKRGGTTVARDVDRSAVPPHIGFIAPMLVTLKIILYQYLRFVGVVAFTPPAKHSAGPDGAITIPF